MAVGGLPASMYVHHRCAVKKCLRRPEEGFGLLGIVYSKFPGECWEPGSGKYFYPVSPILPYFLLLIFETVLAVPLELILKSRLALAHRSACLCLQSAWIKGVHHHHLGTCLDVCLCMNLCVPQFGHRS